MEPLFTPYGSLQFSPLQFSVILRRALGVSFLPATQIATQPTCPRTLITSKRRCGLLLDARLFHASEGCETMKYKKHTTVVSALAKVFKRAHFQVVYEQKLVGSQKRRRLVYPWMGRSQSFGGRRNRGGTAQQRREGTGQDDRGRMLEKGRGEGSRSTRG